MSSNEVRIDLLTAVQARCDRLESQLAEQRREIYDRGRRAKEANEALAEVRGHLDRLYAALGCPDGDGAVRRVIDFLVIEGRFKKLGTREGGGGVA